MRQAVRPNMPATVPPMEVIREEMNARGITDRDLPHFGFTPEEMRNLLGADPRIDEDLSAKISKMLGTSTGIWARLDVRHQGDKANGKPVVTDATAEAVFGIPKAHRSGNVSMRITSSLHQRLLDLAKAEGVSLNQLLLAIVAEGVGKGEQKLGLG